MTIPTTGETFSKLLEHIRLAEENAAMMAHLIRAQSRGAKDNALANGWLSISELFRRMSIKVTELAQGRLQ
jgi:hypothetical protein